MNWKEAREEISKNYHLVHWLFNDTINYILMDLYINFQDNEDDAFEDREKIKKEILDIVTSFKSSASKDGKNYEVVSNPEHYINREVLATLNFILKEDISQPQTIPEIFQKRLRETGRKLTVEAFYRHRH